MENAAKGIKRTSGAFVRPMKSIKSTYVTAIYQLIRELLHHHTTDSLSDALRWLSLMLKRITCRGTVPSDLFDSMCEAFERCGDAIPTNTKLQFYRMTAKHSFPMRGEVYTKVLNHYLQEETMDDVYFEASNKRSEWKLESDPIANGKSLIIKYIKLTDVGGSQVEMSSTLKAMKVDMDTILEQHIAQGRMPSIQLLYLFCSLNLSEMDVCISLVNEFCSTFPHRHIFWEQKIKLLQHKWRELINLAEDGDTSQQLLPDDRLELLNACEEYLTTSCAEEAALQLVAGGWSLLLLSERLLLLAAFLEMKHTSVDGWKTLVEQLFTFNDWTLEAAEETVTLIWDEGRHADWRSRFFCCETTSIGNLPSTLQHLVFIASIMLEKDFTIVEGLSTFLCFTAFTSGSTKLITTKEAVSTTADLQNDDAVGKALQKLLRNIVYTFDKKFCSNTTLNSLLMKNTLLSVFCD